MFQLTIDRGSLPVAKRDSRIKSCTLLAFGKLLKLLGPPRLTLACLAEKMAATSLRWLEWKLSLVLMWV